MQYTSTRPPPAPAPPWLYLGLDLGQAHDFSALAIVERDRPPALAGGQDGYDQYGHMDPVAPDEPGPAAYAVRHLERFPLKTPYPAIVAAVAGTVGRLAARAPAPHLRLVVDMTGVGRPVVDLLKRERLPGRLIDVTITGGDAVARDGSSYRVPKRDLVSVTQIVLQGERLKIASALPEAATLTRELLNFQVKISAETAHDAYGAWREGSHDDLVLAVALACWYAEHEPPARPEAPASFVYWSG